MINRNLLQKGSSHIAIITVLGLVLVGMLGFVFWNNFMRSEPDTFKDNPTYSIKGKITEKRTSCGGEVLDNNGEPKRVKGICDAGNGIVIDKMYISTGGGGLTSNPPKYITNIESVHAGDVVEVRYIKDEDEHSSTNCESCYVKKEGSLNKEPQDKQNR
jgi:hypothetical protein